MWHPLDTWLQSHQDVKQCMSMWNFSFLKSSPLLIIFLTIQERLASWERFGDGDRWHRCKETPSGEEHDQEAASFLQVDNLVYSRTCIVILHASVWHSLGKDEENQNGFSSTEIGLNKMMSLYLGLGSKVQKCFKMFQLFSFKDSECFGYF